MYISVQALHKSINYKETIMAQPAEGELYRHFKGGLYRIVTIAQHTETSEGLVIYRSEEDPSKVWARPLVSFMSPVDKFKYPDADQEMRFEKVDPNAKSVTDGSQTGAAPVAAAAAVSAATSAAVSNAGSAPASGATEAAGSEDKLDPEVEDFLDAKSSTDRLHILASLNHRLTDEMLITMATACDVDLPEGDIRTKYLSLRESLLILGKYEGDRLRK